MTKPATLNEWMVILTNWLLERCNERCLPKARFETMYRYTAQCWLTGKMAVYRSGNGDIEAAIFYWSDWQERIEAKAENNQQQFEWLPSHPGDALFVAEVFGTRRAVARIMSDAFQRFPNLLAVPIYTYRRGQLVRLSMDKMQRFMSHYESRF